MGDEGVAGMIDTRLLVVADDLHVTAENVATFDAMVQVMAGGASGRKNNYPRHGLLGYGCFYGNSLQGISVD